MKKKLMDNKKTILKKIEFRAHYLCRYNYHKYFHSKIEDVIIENIMINGKCHIVSIFKNYLIEDDNSEYIHRFYKFKEIPKRLKYLFNFHIQTSVIFPNYCPLIESKYLYNNVIKKQRIIDEQQRLEEKKSKSKNNKNQSNKDTLFTNSIYDEILNLSESVMRIIFGINNKKNNLKKELKTNENNSETKIDNEKENDLNSNKDNSELITLIKEMDNAEKNMKNINMNKKEDEHNLKIINDNNKSSKSKLKLVLKNINEQLSDDKNYDLYNAKTNNNSSRDFMPSIIPKGNSTIINSYNNFKTIENSNSHRNNIFLVNNETKFENSGKKIKSSSSKKNIIIPYRNLYELNFILKNPAINNLLKTNTNNEYVNKNVKIINTGNNKSNKFFNIFNKPSFLNKTKVNLTMKSNKSNKIINKASKIDLGKLETINNDLLTINNRRKSRNFHEIFIKENSTINKTKKKNDLRSIIIPTSLSPLSKKDKIKDKILAYTSSSNVNTIGNKRSHKSFFSNKNIKTSSKKLFINEYNCIKDSNLEKVIKNKRNYSNKVQ
jgi:hypothetical protein